MPNHVNNMLKYIINYRNVCAISSRRGVAVVGGLMILMFIYVGLPMTHVMEITKEPEITPGIELYLRKMSDNTVSESGYLTNDNKSRIVCIVLTVSDTLETRARVVNATWLKRCNMHFFVLNTNKYSSDIINTPFEETRSNIVHKVRYALGYIYDNHIDDFDWILKADDDTYVIVENLRKLLESKNSNQPNYLGFHFNKFVESGYMSGGAGYVISQCALRHLIELGIQPGLCPIIPNAEDPENSEDIEIGKCLNVSGVSAISSLDEEGRETFHPFPVERHALGWIPEFVYDWAMNRQHAGPECCSKFSVSFHYVNPLSMLLMDHLLYRMSVHGLSTDVRADNTHQTKVSKKT